MLILDRYQTMVDFRTTYLLDTATAVDRSVACFIGRYRALTHDRSIYSVSQTRKSRSVRLRASMRRGCICGGQRAERTMSRGLGLSGWMTDTTEA